MTKPKHLIILHGFASSSRSKKAQFLREKLAEQSEIMLHALDFNPTPQDFEYMTVTGMINRLRQYVLDHELDPFYLIGSSMGALVAVHYVHRFGGVRRLLLLAPLLAYFDGSRDVDPTPDPNAVDLVTHYAFEGELPLRRAVDVDGALYKTAVPPAAPTLIIHGRFDDVIPLHFSEAYAAQYPQQVQLQAVDSDHPLRDQLDLMWAQINGFLLAE